MANILPPVEFATITGRFMVAGNDSDDLGAEADIVPAKGKGSITPSVGHVLVSGSTPPATVKLATVDFEIDSEGYISDAKTKGRNVQVIAPSEAVNPSAFTYRINFDGGLFPGFDFYVVPGSTIDLTAVGRVATSVGVATTRGETGVGVASMTLSPDQASLVVAYDDGTEQAVAMPTLGEVATYRDQTLAAKQAVDDALAQANVFAQDQVPPYLQETALSATYAPRTHVVVGPNADFQTVADALAAHPSGNVDIELASGTVPAGTMPATISGVKNVTLRGQGPTTTVVECAGPFINAVSNSDGWQVTDFSLHCTTAENTHDGIKVDYPRRWLVRRVHARGYGGTSIWYRGGIHSAIEFCYIIAKDSANINGYAGVRCSRSSTDVPATVFASRHNYVGSGKQYGFLFDQTNVGTVFDQDTAELCDVGMRFQQCSGELRSPYTEANRLAGIETHDSLLVLAGRLRDLPNATWAAVGATDRRQVYIGNKVINAGQAVIFPSSSGVQTDPALATSVQGGTGTPEGSKAALPGSLYLRTDGFVGMGLYVKEAGTGNTGWVTVGAPQVRAATQFTSASNSVNNQGKFTGKMAWSSSANRPVWATGPNPTDPWVWADGTVAYTPT